MRTEYLFVKPRDSRDRPEDIEANYSTASVIEAGERARFAASEFGDSPVIPTPWQSLPSAFLEYFPFADTLC